MGRTNKEMEEIIYRIQDIINSEPYPQPSLPKQIYKLMKLVDTRTPPCYMNLHQKVHIEDLPNGCRNIHIVCTRGKSHHWIFLKRRIYFE